MPNIRTHEEDLGRAVQTVRQLCPALQVRQVSNHSATLGAYVVYFGAGPAWHVSDYRNVGVNLDEFDTADQAVVYAAQLAFGNLVEDALIVRWEPAEAALEV